MALNPSPARVTAIVACHLVLSSTVIVSTRSTFSAYTALVIGVALVAVLGEANRGFRIVDDALESSSLLVTRRIPVSHISSAGVRDDQWGVSTLVVRGRGARESIAIPLSLFADPDDELRGIAALLRRLADEGRDIDLAVPGLRPADWVAGITPRS